jgi:hypothetical protein
MIVDDELEKKLQKHELAFQELAIKTDNLNQQVDELLAELNIFPEQLTTFIGNKENFSEENWQEIVKLRQELDEKLKRELANVRNPLKNKKTYSDRVVSQHWLYVR